MSEELKPCPFCGGDGEIMRSGHSIYALCTECNSVGMSVNIFYCRSNDEVEYQKELLIDQWNARAESSELIALRQQNAELVGALKLVNTANNMSNVTGWDKVMESLK